MVICFELVVLFFSPPPMALALCGRSSGVDLVFPYAKGRL
jgi:hypothetical protein